ncbi:P-loop containing nucleoside triphosphate hydrolase protein [Xylariaceae sp. FL1272]|nr:P-loop containing nucleoside triphosphate hydrolase protein [Xylariaceae sp. FL1272]
MAASNTPVKTREVQNQFQDSTIWNGFKYRPDDIVIATHSKSGTTWMQQIVSQLIHHGAPTVSPAAISPWVEFRAAPREMTYELLEAQEHRRFIKTHLPADAVAWSTEAKYIFVARDTRDAVWSMHNHFFTVKDAYYDMINGMRGDIGPAVERPTENPRDMFMELVDDDIPARMTWPYWNLMRSWWERRDQPNVLFVHFNDLKKDLDGEMRRVAKFLEIPELSGNEWTAAVEHCTFDWMKAHADLSAPKVSSVIFKEGATNFFNKGTNGHWADVLSKEDIQRYEEKSRHELGEEYTRWLENGRLQ